jgi:hypothetical protein
MGFGIKKEGGSNSTPSEIVYFDKLTPTTAGVVFTPNTPQTLDVLYLSSVDASTWIWNGTAYIIYSNSSSSTEWYLNGTTIDAGSNKTAPISRLDSIYVLNNDSYFNGVRVGAGNYNNNNNTIVGNSSGGFTTGGQNSFFGKEAGYSNTSGGNNTFIGQTSGYSNIDGEYNTSLGAQSFYSNTEGSYNTAIGGIALYSNTTGYGNIAIGIESLLSNTTGGSSLAIGNQSLKNNVSGYENTAIGHQSMFSNTTGYYNTGVGELVLYSSTTASFNTGVGLLAGYGNIIGEYNTFVGLRSGQNSKTSYNTFVGAYSGYNNTTGLENTFIGHNSGAGTTSGANNTFVGKSAGYDNSTGSGNLYLGHSSGLSNLTGSFNLFIGNSAGRTNTDADFNTFIGFSSGFSNTLGYENTFLGLNSGYNNTEGYQNLFIGLFSGYENTLGYQNTFIGLDSGYNNTIGVFNTFLGYKSGFYNSTAFKNAFVGTQSGYYNTTGSFNAFFGESSGLQNTTGDNNSFFGRDSGRNNTTGESNTYIGGGAGLYSQTNSYNTLVGFGAGLDNSGDENVFIGYQSGITNGGRYNVFVGSNSGKYNSSAEYNTFLGGYSGLENTTGQYNTFLGMASGYNNTTAQYNTFVGYVAGYFNTTGSSNDFFGNASGYFNTTGSANLFVGTASGYANLTGNNNTFFGGGAGYSSDASYNTFIGQGSGRSNITGESNTFLGHNSGRFVADGISDLETISNSVFLGRETKALADNQTNQIVIGYNAIGKGSNTINIGNTSITDTYLNGAVTINNAYELPTIDGSPGYILQTNGAGVTTWATASSGGGSSVNYYLNGSVNQGTFGGNTYYELGRVPVNGVGTDFNISTDGIVARFITDANDPAQLLIPGGNFNLEFFFSSSSSGGTPSFYANFYKYSGTTFTLIGSNSLAPEGITNGTAIDIYLTAVSIPTTTLTLTDRIAIEIYVNCSSKTITLHTEDSHLCEVITTFSSGLSNLNGLTASVQSFATGTTGTDFNISSLGSIHTFNLPTASATIRGALSSTDWSTFSGKQNTITLTTTGTSGASTLIGNTLNIPAYSFSGTNIYNANGILTGDRNLNGNFNILQFDSIRNMVAYIVPNLGDVYAYDINVQSNNIAVGGRLWRIYDNDLGAERISVLKNGQVAINNSYILPTTDGSSGQYITTDGVGTLSWSTITPTPTTEDVWKLNPNETYRGFSFNNNSTTIVSDGGAVQSASASTLAQNVGNTSFASKQIRLRYYASSVSGGRYTGQRGTAQLWFIEGGFRYVCDFNISDTSYSAGCQQFYGLAGQLTDLAYGGVTGILVSTLTNCIGVGNDTNDTNLQIFHNDSTGTCTKIDLGVGFPSNRTAGAISTTFYQIQILNIPASASVQYRVVNKETGAIATGTLSSNLPTSTLGLNFFASRTMSNPSVTGTGQFDLSKLGVYSMI